MVTDTDVRDAVAGQVDTMVETVRAVLEENTTWKCWLILCSVESIFLEVGL